MMSSIDNKKAKRRKVKKSAVTKAATPTKSLTNSEVPLTRTELTEEAFKNLEKTMDAPFEESALKMLLFPRGTNPFLDRERCLLCNCERTDPPEAEALKSESEDNQSLENNPLAQLPLWVCPSCRKAADQEMEKKPSLEQFLDTDGESFLPDISIKSGSEPTTPNGSICTCDACTERRMIESEHELETAALQQYWTELRKVVRCLYGNRDDINTDELNTNRVPADDHVTDLVHKLCSRDPHQLFLRLESQVREFVIEMKVKLLKQLSTGFKTPPQAKKFISLMLEEYAHLCKVARKMAGLLKELQNHLKRFKVTWDLHNKHLFQSIVFSEPSIKNSLNLLISQLRLGAASKESYTEDTYPNLLHRYLKFEDEMSVINVVWRDCHQLIESYNEEQSTLKLKQKMLREDWEFFKTQRKLLEQQVSKNPKASLSHNLEAQFTETMRLMLQGNKPSQDELTCPRCNRKRCPCDECTITHMITCGIINPDVLDSSTAPNPLTSHHNANFMHDPNRYRIDVSPPSMSSTTSSSGSSSPIFDVEHLKRPFTEDSNRNEEEIQEEIDNQSSDNDDDDGVDEEEDDDDADDADNEEEANDKDDTNINDLPLTGMVEITGIPQLSLEEEMRRQDFGKVESCNCDHCVSQAKLEQIKPEDNQCQCHVCLQQQGKAISTTLPQHIPPIVPRPGELHLYPHIHGSTGLHTLGRGSGHVRPILQPNLYDLHLPNQRHKSIIQQTKVPIKLDFDSPEGINDHIYHAYGDWDNTTYDHPRLLLGSGKFDSELLPPAPLSSPYTSTLLTEPLNLPGMFSTSSSLPTSATSSAFVSTFANHASSGVATQAATKITDNLSVLTTKESLGDQLPSKHNQCSNQPASIPNHNPPCSRPATLGGNNAPKVPEKGHSQHCKKHNNIQGNTKSGTVTSHNHAGNQLKVQEMLQTKEGRQMFQQYTNSLKQQSNQNNPTCTHANSNNNNISKLTNHQGSLREPHNGAAGTGTCPNSMQLPTSVNNVSVGTSTVCTEPDCDGNHDNDSFDDNCSEKSSSTSNSTSQKEGKYCDCCYCEFFGHGNPPVAPTSKNYAEMRDKLRLRLKKKVETETKPDGEHPPISLKCTGSHIPQGKPAPVLVPPTTSTPPPPSLSEDPLETKGLDELIKFINGTEEDDKKPLSAKAAKRARQKQRKAEEKARLEAEQVRKEQERERKLQLEEEQRRQAEEVERRKNEAMTKKQRKQAAKRAKSSSNSPTPPPPNTLSNSTEKNLTNNAEQSNKNLKKKGKHKEDLPTLQVNITCEIEHGSQPVSSSKPVNNNTPVNQNPLKTTAPSSRPSTQGGHIISTPPSIDNRNILIAKQNKNKEPIKAPHLSGNDNSNTVTINSEHIAQITRQQQELLKKQTQQLIQLKLQQEAKKQRQLAAQQQQQQQQQQCPQQQQSISNDKGKKVNIKILPNEKPSQGQLTPPMVTRIASEKPQVQPVKNNVKITVKTSTNSVPMTNPPRLIEQNNNVPRRINNGKTVQQINDENSLNQTMQPQSTLARRNKKSPDLVQPEQGQKGQPQLQNQYHVQGLVSNRPISGPANHTLQQNGRNSPGKGQIRQPPAGQAQNGDVRTPNMDKKQDVSKKQEDSPPSDQGKNSSSKTKKVKRKNKGGGDINFIDEVFMPKSESDIECGDMDEFEREIEEFKRFCADSSTPAKREKLQVNVNIKDIFAKKKSGLCN